MSRRGRPEPGNTRVAGHANGAHGCTANEQRLSGYCVGSAAGGAVHGTISRDPCDRDAEGPGGYCMAWQYGSQLYKTNETCGLGASKGVCATLRYVCPEGAAV